MGDDHTLSLREEMARSLKRQAQTVPARNEMYKKEKRRSKPKQYPRRPRDDTPPENPTTPPWVRGQIEGVERS